MKLKLTFLILLWVQITNAQFLNVPADYPTIQESIDAAQSGDTIMVAPGTYTENINLSGKDVFLTSMFHIDHSPATIEATIIDGSNPTNPDSASVITIINHETAAAVIQGFTIRGGTGTNNFNEDEGIFFRVGGGILINEASPTIQFNIIEDNEALDDSASDVVSAGGGGLRAGRSESLVQNNIVRRNKGHYAAGMMFAFSAPTIRNNLVIENEAGFFASGGGGIFVDFNADNSRPVPIINNTIINNTSGGRGGGIIVTGTTLQLENNIVYNNTAFQNKQIFLRDIGAGVPKANVNYSNLPKEELEGNLTGANNVHFEPIFVGNYYSISNDSPLIDSGNPDPIYNDHSVASSDTPHVPAQGTLRNDIGWTGGPAAFAWEPLMSGINDIKRKAALLQLVTNPIRNHQIHIEYTLAQKDDLQFQLYDIQGKLIQYWNMPRQRQGEQQITLPITPEFVSGQYYLSLTGAHHYETLKLSYNN